MNINNIGSIDRFSAARENNRSNRSSNESNADKQLGTPDEIGASVSISDEAFKMYKSSEPFTRKMEKSAIQNEESREALPVQTVLREGTAEHFIFNALDGKVENAHELAVELGKMIFDRGENKETNLEERALNRETGKMLAEYIASNYLDNPDEAQAFLEGINKHAKTSEMYDKGYIVIIGSNIEPFKPKFDELQKFAKDNYGYGKVDWSDTKKSDEIYKAFVKETMTLAHNEGKNSSYFGENLPDQSLLTYDFSPHMYMNEKATFNAAFDKNEKAVQEIINSAKGAVNSKDMSTILNSMSTDKSNKWNNLTSLLQKG